MTYCIVHKDTALPQCGFSYGFSNNLLELLHSCIVCTCASSPQCGWAGEFSDLKLDWKTCCIVHNCGSFPHCEWQCVSLNYTFCWIPFGILHNGASAFHCGWACGSSGVLLDQKIFHIAHNCAAPLQHPNQRNLHLPCQHSLTGEMWLKPRWNVRNVLRYRRSIFVFLFSLSLIIAEKENYVCVEREI